MQCLLRIARFCTDPAVIRFFEFFLTFLFSIVSVGVSLSLISLLTRRQWSPRRGPQIFIWDFPAIFRRFWSFPLLFRLRLFPPSSSKPRGISVCRLGESVHFSVALPFQIPFPRAFPLAPCLSGDTFFPLPPHTPPRPRRVSVRPRSLLTPSLIPAWSLPCLLAPSPFLGFLFVNLRRSSRAVVQRAVWLVSKCLKSPPLPVAPLARSIFLRLSLCACPNQVIWRCRSVPPQSSVAPFPSYLFF